MHISLSLYIYIYIYIHRYAYISTSAFDVERKIRDHSQDRRTATTAIVTTAAFFPDCKHCNCSRTYNCISCMIL